VASFAATLRAAATPTTPFTPADASNFAKATQGINLSDSNMTMRPSSPTPASIADKRIAEGNAFHPNHNQGENAGQRILAAVNGSQSSSRMASPESHDYAHPSAMPPPLEFGLSSPRSPTAMLPIIPSGSGHDWTVLPDGHTLITHFDIMNQNVVRTGGNLHDAVRSTCEQIVNQIFRKNDTHMSEITERFGDVIEHLNGVEHNVNRLKDATVNTKDEVNKLNDTVTEKLVVKIEQLLRTNENLTAKVETLSDRVKQLEAKHTGVEQGVHAVQQQYAQMQQAQAQQQRMPTAQYQPMYMPGSMPVVWEGARMGGSQPYMGVDPRYQQQQVGGRDGQGNRVYGDGQVHRVYGGSEVQLQVQDVGIEIHAPFLERKIS